MGILFSTQIMIVDTQANLPSSAATGQFAYCLDTTITLIYNGSAWLPGSKVQVKKTTVSVNGKNTGTTTLYTLEASSLNFYPIMIVPRATGVGVSGVVTGPTMSIGTNSSSYNNLANATLMGSLLTSLTGGSSVASTTTSSPALAGGTAIVANVTIGAVATNYTELFDIIGFYDS